MIIKTSYVLHYNKNAYHKYFMIIRTSVLQEIMMIVHDNRSTVSYQWLWKHEGIRHFLLTKPSVFMKTPSTFHDCDNIMNPTSSPSWYIHESITGNMWQLPWDFVSFFRQLIQKNIHCKYISHQRWNTGKLVFNLNVGNSEISCELISRYIS